MIILARESRGYTQKQLSEILDVTQGRISRMEGGTLIVPDDLLSQMADKLNYPESFFLEKAYIYPPISPFHRKRKALPKKIQSKIEAEANIQRLHISKLLRATEVPDNAVLFQDLDDLDITPSEAAKRLRRHWKMPRGPINNMTQLIEDSGIIVIHRDLGTTLTDGFSVIVTELPPLIFINSNTPGDRLRFTLAHELGHIVMHTVPTPEIEDEANEFAAEFLLPEDDIKPYLMQITFPKLASLKRYWKVSMASLIYRASKLKTLTSNQSRHMWVKYSKNGYRRKEPIDIPKEKPALLDELIELHISDLKYSISEMCNILMCSHLDYMKLYKGRKLQLVDR